MQEFQKKDSSSAAYSYIVTCPSSWGTSVSTNTNVQGSSMADTLSLTMEVMSTHFPVMQHQSGVQVQDQDSSSTQSTEHSCGEVASFGAHLSDEGNPPKINGNRTKSTSSIVSQDSVFPPAQASWPLHCAEPPHFGGLLASAYAPQPMMAQTPMMGLVPSRLLLPQNLPENEPIYVNAKQYHAILRRRQHRAKLEAQNKLIKNRKPYLHESRHLHALKRARGSGGRFLNTKKLHESKQPPPESRGHVNISGHPRSFSKNPPDPGIRRREIGNGGSDFMTSGSNSNHRSSNNEMFEHPQFRFSGYNPSSNHHVSVLM